MDIVEKAVSVLIHDGVIVYPTETVYGLGADAFSDEAILRVYEAKQRPLSMPVSIAVSDFDMFHSVARADAELQPFLDEFLPGPVTVILPARKCVPPVLTGGTGLIGIRMPAHDLALRLIAKFDAPITATSANLHGAREPVTPAECTVPHDFLIDGGRLPGTPSTVIDLTKKHVIRAGADIDRVAKFLSTL
jgi:L-threonylcarbamoyladenylate synthase